MGYRERDIIKFCVCKMPTAARDHQRYKAKSFGQTYIQTYLLTEWFIELHFAAKKCRTIDPICIIDASSTP